MAPWAASGQEVSGHETIETWECKSAGHHNGC